MLSEFHLVHLSWVITVIFLQVSGCSNTESLERSATTDENGSISIIPNHGGTIKSVAFHVLGSSKICNLSQGTQRLKASVDEHIGSDNVCLNNHLVVPNWNPSGDNGIEGLFTGTGLYPCLRGCNLNLMFSASLRLQDSYRKLADEYDNLKLETSEGLEVANQKRELEEQLSNARNQLKLQLTRDFAKNFIVNKSASEYSGCTSNTGPVRTFRDRFCRQNNWGFCRCVDEYSKNLVAYLQDWYLVSESAGERQLIRSWARGTVSKREVEMHANYLIKQCDCGIKKSIESKIMFEGGDILVSDKFALVGKDILLRYLKKVTNDNHLEVTRVGALRAANLPTSLNGLTPQNSLLVYQKIKDELFPDKKLLLLGLDSRSFNNGNKTPASLWFKSFQPNYHLDISFALIGERSDGEFTILVARPDTKYLEANDQQNPEIQRFYQDYNNKVDTVVWKIRDFLLDECGYSSFLALDVPMLAKPQKLGQKHWVFVDHKSFINGIPFSQSPQDFSFAYSDFLNPSNEDIYSQAKEDFENVLSGAGINPLAITYNFPGSKNYGLRCISKVLKRE